MNSFAYGRIFLAEVEHDFLRPALFDAEIPLEETVADRRDIESVITRRYTVDSEGAVVGRNCLMRGPLEHDAHLAQRLTGGLIEDPSEKAACCGQDRRTHECCHEKKT